MNGIRFSSGTGQYRASEVHVGITSRTWKPSTGRGILYCHGYTETGYSNVRSDTIGLLAQAGYTVMTADLAGVSTWGNSAVISAVGDAVTYLQGTLDAKSGTVGLLGVSMGAASALAWARANLSSVFAVALEIPVLDVDDIYQNNKSGLQGTIGTAYGVTYPTSLGDLSTHSPVAFSSSALAGIPIKAWAASNDPLASTTAQVQSWGGKGATLTTVDLGAVGHNGSSVPPGDVVAWFDACSGRT